MRVQLTASAASWETAFDETVKTMKSRDVTCSSPPVTVNLKPHTVQVASRKLNSVNSAVVPGDSLISGSKRLDDRDTCTRR